MRSPLLAAVLVVGIILAAAMALLLLFRPAGSRAPIDSLPSDTRLLVRLSDPEAFSRALSRTRLGRGGAPDGGAVLAGILAEILQRQGLPVRPAAAEAALAMDGETLLAVVPSEAGEPAGVALAIDLRRMRLATPEWGRRLVPGIADAEGEAAWSLQRHHDREYMSLRTSNGAAIHVASLRGIGMIASSGACLRRMLDALDGRTASLRSDPVYRAARDAVPGQEGLFAYASGAWIAAQADARAPAGPARRTLKLLGLEAVRGAAAAIAVRGDTFQERLFIAMRSDRRGLPGALFDAPPRARPVSRTIPGELPFHVAASWSGLGAVRGKLPDLLSSSLGGDRQDFRSRLEGLERFFAIDLRRDLLEALGDEMVIGFGATSRFPRGAPNRAHLNLPVVMEVGLNRRDAIAALLGRLDGLARGLGAYERGSRDGQAMTAYRFAALAPLAPAYRMAGGRLIAASSPELLAAALNAAARRRSLADRPEVEAAAARLPPRRHLFFLGDSARMLDLAGALQRPEGRAGLLPAAMIAGLAALPAESDLPPTAATVRVTAGGLLLDAVGPISPALLACVWLAPGAERGVVPGAGSDAPVPPAIGGASSSVVEEEPY